MKIIFTVLFSFTILLSTESSVLASPRELKQTSAIWRGGYVGFNIGNRIINYEYSHVTNTTSQTSTQTIRTNYVSLAEEIHAGFAHQFSNNMYFGLQVGLTFSQGKFKNAASTTNPSSISERSIQFGNSIATNVHLGYVLQPKLIIYGIAGWSFLKIKDSIKNNSPSYSTINDINEYVNGPNL